MTVPPSVLVATVTTGLLLGFSVWVLLVQALSLARTMPSPKFLGLQIRIVRIWGRTLIPIALAGSIAALVRVGWSPHALPAVFALVAAAAAALLAIPRALDAGRESIRSDEARDLTSSGFVSEGGGARTRVWHRLLLLTVVVMLGGRLLDGYCALESLVISGEVERSGSASAANGFGR